MIQLYTWYRSGFWKEDQLNQALEEAGQAQKLLHDRTGEGKDCLGWLDYPSRISRQELDIIQQTAEKIREESQVLLVIGIGGSYLGARAAIEFLHTSLYNQLRALDKKYPEIYFIGNNVNAGYLQNTFRLIGERDVSVNVISKSGTTTEPALAFRIVRKYMEQRYGKSEAAKRIYCTTDPFKGKLKETADKEGYPVFKIPEDIGGRYSVLTPVGLLPIAVSGGDIYALMAGAKEAQQRYAQEDKGSNDCCRYAAVRNVLYRQGREIELLVSHDPSMVQLAEWFKQLFAESEGKEGKGLFPVSVTYPTDLHAIGQYIQQGKKMAFETVMWVCDQEQDIKIPLTDEDYDGLDYLAGCSLNKVARKAMLGALLAHTEGNVPNILLTLDKQDAFHLGWLFYFFEKACAISGYMLGVNPFDQPGVEAYKGNMFALLNKPGYEQEAQIVCEQLSEFELV